MDREKWSTPNIVTTCLILFIGLSVLFGFDQAFAQKPSPVVKAGYLDLSGWDFDTQGPVYLDGTWEFHWQRHILPEDFKGLAKELKPTYLEVPGYWNGHQVRGHDIGGDGYATYRVRVKLKEGVGLLSVYFGVMGTSSKIFINGRLAARNGNPSTDKNTTKPWYQTRVIDLNQRGEELELVVWISNYDYDRGGIWSQIRLGRPAQIHASRVKKLNLNSFIMGSLLMMGFYHVLLFVLRRREISSLVFGIFCFLIGLRILVTDEFYLVELWPSVPWALMLKVEYLTYYLSAIALPNFLLILFPKEFNRFVLKAINILFGLCAASVILLPVRFFSETLGVAHLLTVIMLVYILWVILLGVSRRRLGALVFLIGFLFLFATVLNDILHVRGIIQTGYIVALGLFVFTLSQAYVLNRRFSIAYETIEHQSRDLLEKNEAVLKELNERQRAEVALQESEQKFRSVYDSSRDAITITTDIGFLDSNTAALEMFGYTSKEEFCQHHPADVSPYTQPDGTPSRQKANGLIAAAFQGKGKVFEWMHRRKDGTDFPTEILLSPMKWEGREVVQAVIRDITDRKIAEEALRNNERKLHAIFDHHYQLTGLIDTDGRLLAANRTALHFAGAEESEVIGQYFWNGPWWGPSQKSELQNAVERAVKGEFVRFETTHPSAEGQIRDIDFSLSPVRDDDGNVIYVVPEGRDITEVKRAEQEKAKLQEQLNQAQKMEALGTLAGGIAHDFNNILAAIFGYAELAKMLLPTSNKASGYIGEILKAGNRAKELVQQILTFSRQTEHELKPVSVKIVTKEALKLIRATLPSTIEIRQNIVCDSLVLGDPTQLHQIIMNLCTNAGHAMSEDGGVLEVELKSVTPDSMFTANYPELKPGEYVNLTVTDTGHGMTADILNRIFDPFFTTKEKGEGTGMGLAVIHGIVTSYGGMIQAYSEPGKASSFKVFLPAIEGRHELEKEHEAVLPQGNERILFVDDEPAIIDISKQILEYLGYHVTVQSSSLDALELFKTQPDAFDLVITDLTMPKMAGDRLAMELMSIRLDIPIIICTGFSNRIAEETARKMGIKGLLMKPIISSELARKVRAVLDLHKGYQL